MKNIKYLIMLIIGSILIPLNVFATDESVTSTPSPTEATASPTISLTPTRAIRSRTNPTPRDTNTQAASIAAQKAENRAAHCELIETKVNIKINKFTNNLARRHAFYNRFSNRVEKIITKFEALGYNVSKLKADLVVLNQKIAAYEAAKTAYIAVLKQTQLYACGKSNVEFITKLSEARVALTSARQANLDVRNYYQQTIRPDILALKNQVISSATATISPTVTITPTISTTTPPTPSTTPQPENIF